MRLDPSESHCDGSNPLDDPGALMLWYLHMYLEPMYPLAIHRGRRLACPGQGRGLSETRNHASPRSVELVGALLSPAHLRQLERTLPLLALASALAGSEDRLVGP